MVAARLSSSVSILLRTCLLVSRNECDAANTEQSESNFSSPSDGVEVVMANREDERFSGTCFLRKVSLKIKLIVLWFECNTKMMVSDY